MPRGRKPTHNWSMPIGSSFDVPLSGEYTKNGTDKAAINLASCAGYQRTKHGTRYCIHAIQELGVVRVTRLL